MNNLHLLAFCLLLTQGGSFAETVAADSAATSPQRHELTFRGQARHYYLQPPPGDRGEGEPFHVIVTVHGGGGNGRSHFLANGLREAVRKAGFPAIVVSPSFSNEDFDASRFPALGEGAFLEAVLADLRSGYRCREKIFLTGYSRGGQFSHRFAFAHPELVAAVAPCAAGTWTTPEGFLLVEALETIKNPGEFLLNPANAEAAPKRLRTSFTKRVAAVAGNLPRKGARKIPFLVMCGSLDTRFEISKKFAASLKVAGFSVETQWPRTPHGSRNKVDFQAEFLKYPGFVFTFFCQITERSSK